jgi:hypothetical protein
MVVAKVFIGMPNLWYGWNTSSMHAAGTRHQIHAGMLKDGTALARSPEQEAGGAAAATAIAVPGIEHLRTNFRTHSGIIDVAAAIVDVLRRYFPQHLDRLAREKAFFQVGFS